MIPRKKFYLIGTMNTSDRSIGRIDYAVRRRFAFLHLNPNESVIDLQKVPDPDKSWAKNLFNAVKTLFGDVASGGYLAPDFNRDDVQVGHTYFLGDHETVRIRFAYQVWPLLREYFKDGVLSAESGKIGLVLPGSEEIDLMQEIDSQRLLSKTDSSWERTPGAKS
jgi:5-methylcytosine-specific restriction enzyme B